MKIFGGLFSLFDNGSTTNTSFGTEVNPANGLPMTAGLDSLDVAGNPYGTDFSNTNSGLDNGFPSHSNGGGCDFSSGGGSGFDGFGGFGSGSDW